jgi:putative peptidoglycan lipid II flippase
MLRSTVVTGSMTLLSRISGLARDKVFSFAFGSEPVMDAFFVAFKIPNLLRRFFAEGAFSAAFVPVLAETRERGDRESVRALVGRVSGTLAVILFCITLIGVIAAPVLIYVFAPGFDALDGRRTMAVTMLRWTFPYLLFISLTALAGAVLNTYQRFAVPAFTPLLLNLVLILFAGWLAPGSDDPGRVLAIGVFVAGLAQLCFQLPFVASLRVFARPRWAWRDSTVRRILKLMLPVMLGSTVAQINILFDTLIATLLAAGSVSWLYYSDRLVEFPLGVFGIALATVILPALSRDHALQSPQRFSVTLDWALHLVVLIALPAAVGLFMLAEPMIATIFFGGAFGGEDVSMAAWSLMAFAPGLIAFILVKVLSPGYFARQDTKTPVRIAIRALVLGMVLNVVLVYLAWQTQWAPAHAGLAAATSLSAMFNAGALLRGLLRERVYVPSAGWLRFIAQVVAACGVMAIAVALLQERYGDWLAMSGPGRIVALAVCIFVPMAVYATACIVVGIRVSELRAPGSQASL